MKKVLLVIFFLFIVFLVSYPAFAHPSTRNWPIGTNNADDVGFRRGVILQILKTNLRFYVVYELEMLLNTRRRGLRNNLEDAQDELEAYVIEQFIEEYDSIECK